MKIFLLFLLPLFLVSAMADAQTFPIDTIRYNGDPSVYINIVILGDGYTSGEQTDFISDAEKLSDYLLSQTPWANYANYFNVFAIKVPSAESGTAHPNTAPDCGSGVPALAVNTYFGCTFDAYNIHRLVVPMNGGAVAQVLAANFPNYDQILMIAHSEYYGGSGGGYATATVNISSNEIVAHEIGHSFATLADEYWAGPQYAAEKPNMTQQSDPSLIKWKNWLSAGTGIDIIPFSENPSWHKPNNNCKMQSLGRDYCSVCSEGIIEKIHSLTDPVVSYSPAEMSVNVSSASIPFALDTVIAPIPNTLRIRWMLDSKLIESNATSVQVDPKQLTDGPHTLIATVLDTSTLVRKDAHATSHITTVTWTIDKTAPKVTIPSAVAFGDLRIQTERDTTIWFYNAGTAPVQIIKYALTQPSTGFTIIDSSSHTIPARDSSKLVLRFAPVLTQSYSGTLVVSTNEATSSNHAIVLSGRGTDSKLQLSANSIEFGTVDSGVTLTKSITISNEGNAPATISALQIDPDSFFLSSVSAPFVLPPSETDTILVSFRPLKAGEVSGLLTISSTETVPLEVLLHGIGKGDTSQSVVISSRKNRISTSLYPNPATSVVTVSVTMEKAELVSIEVITLDGKTVLEVPGTGVTDKFTTTIPLEGLAAGTYGVRYTIGGLTHQEFFIKR